MPASIWARVPKNTSASDRANSTTVSRSDASGRNTLRNSQCSRGRGAGGGGASGRASAGRTAAGAGLGEVCTEVLFIGGSRELDGIDERLEVRLLGGDHGGLPLHLEEPRLVAHRHHDHEHPGRVLVLGLLGVAQVNVLAGDAP